MFRDEPKLVKLPPPKNNFFYLLFTYNFEPLKHFSERTSFQGDLDNKLFSLMIIHFKKVGLGLGQFSFLSGLVSPIYYYL